MPGKLTRPTNTDSQQLLHYYGMMKKDTRSRLLTIACAWGMADVPVLPALRLVEAGSHPVRRKRSAD